jgi:hypothetical protein
MYQISLGELLRFAKSVEGKVLKTLHRSAEFTVVVTEDSLFYVPKTSNKRTKDDRGCLEKICEEFCKTKEYRPSHYVKSLRAWHASYTLTLIHKCLNQDK